LGDIFGGTGGFSDFFQSIFGGMGAGTGRRRARPRGREGFAIRGSDIEARIELSLEEAHRGTQPTLTYHSLRTCPDCQGSGIQARRQCPTCLGQGQIRAPRTITVKIAPGARDGSTVRIPGKGEPSPTGGPPGDLYLKVSIKPHPTFKVVGKDDIQTDVQIAPWEAALGTRVRVPTLEGHAEVTVPPGTQGGARLRLKGQGLKRRNGTRGDQYVRVQIAVPQQLNPREKELFEALARESSFKPRG